MLKPEDAAAAQGSSADLQVHDEVLDTEPHRRLGRRGMSLRRRGPMINQVDHRLTLPHLIARDNQMQHGPCDGHAHQLLVEP